MSVLIMSALELIESIEWREVHAMLSSKCLSESEFRSLYAWHQKATMLSRLNNIGKEPPAKKITASRFRQLLDEWLNTGIGPDGSESPQRRSLTKATIARAAIQRSVQKNQVELVFRPGERPEFEIVLKTWHSDKNDASFEPVQSAFDSADALFTALMASDLKLRICKCRYSKCGKYFLHPKPRRSYSSGIFCSGTKCQSSAAGVRRSAKTRSAVLEMMIDIAARYLVKQRRGQAWHSDKRVKLALANAVSRRLRDKSSPPILRQHEPVQQHWITRHLNTIEKRRSEIVSRER
jgi:hypothetical protein